MTDRRQYSIVFKITLFLSASFVVNVQPASVTKSGQLNACDGPCTDYAIVVTPRFEKIVMKIYKIKRHKGNPITTPSDIQQLKVNPGNMPTDIIKLARSPKDFDVILFSLVKAAKKAIPKKYHRGTPFFFLSSFIMEDIYSFAFTRVIMRVMEFVNDVKRHPFLPPSKHSIKKILGTTEMMYRWITANFLAGNLLPSKHNIANDMGLLNVNLNLVSQIAFPVYHMDKNVTQSVSVGGDTYLLAAGSFTKKGLSRGLRLYIQSLTKGKPPIKREPSATSNPHFDIATDMEVLSGSDIPSDVDMKGSAYMNIITTRQNIGGLPNAAGNAGKRPMAIHYPNTASQIASPCSPAGTQLQVNDAGKEYNINGTGDVDKCREVILKVILEDYERSSRSPYILSPRRSVKFYALKEIVPVLETFGCHDCKHTFNVAKIDAVARKYCSGKISSNNMPASTTGCLNVNFFYTMLTRAYHIKRGTPITVLKASKHHIEEDWALGALLYKMKLLG